jgi:ribosomal protein S18 acetylase RimI-like enzyme
MNIRQLSLVDLGSITILHLSAFPTGTLTVFGAETVNRYYSYQINRTDKVICLGAYLENQLVGICVAGEFMGSEIGFLKKNLLFLIFQLLSHPWLIFDVKVCNRVRYALNSFSNFVINNKVLRKVKISSANERFGIQSIAVHPRYQGLGIGKQLLQNAETIAHQKGYILMRLTVHTDNYQAISFYEKMGWRKIIRQDFWDGYMEKEIPNNIIKNRK